MNTDYLFFSCKFVTMLELGLAFPWANIVINKETRLFCNDFVLHPDHILQQLSTSISYFELEIVASWPLDMELAMKDYAHYYSTLFIQAIVIIFSPHLTFCREEIQISWERRSNHNRQCPKHQITATTVQSPVQSGTKFQTLFKSLSIFLSSFQPVFWGGWLPGRVKH